MKIDFMLAEMLVDVPHLSLTTDIWSCSSAQQSIISLTTQWVMKEFERISAVLDGQKCEGSYTDEYICKKLEDMF